MMKTSNTNTCCVIQLCSQNTFEVIITEAVDESLTSFKNLDTQKVFAQLENAFDIKKHEIPYKIEDFSDAMEKMFGVGAKLIEIRIIQAIHRRMPEFIFSPNRGPIIFKDYVNSLRSFLM